MKNYFQYKLDVQVIAYPCFNQNLNIFIQENAFDFVIWKTVAFSSRPQCFNQSAVMPGIKTTGKLMEGIFLCFRF